MICLMLLVEAIPSTVKLEKPYQKMSPEFDMGSPKRASRKEASNNGEDQEDNSRGSYISQLKKYYVQLLLSDKW
jgi:hypothetical protein